MAKKIPHTLIILTVILIVFTGLTWIVPAGEFERMSDGSRDIVVPGSYKVTEQSPQGFFDFFTSPIKGFISAGQIIAFVLIVGGAFSVINRSDAINAALQSLVRLCRKKPAFKKVIIPALIILFSLAGATFGMSEEVIVFVLITIPLSLALGYDSLVGIAIPFVGAGAGFAGAFSNPFTVGIAQGIAELPPFSGSGYRILCWGILTLVPIIFIMLYIRKLEKDPSISPMYEMDQKRDNHLDEVDEIKFTMSRKIILALFFGAIALLIYGVSNLGWYINEIAGLFFALAVISAIVYRMAPNDAAESFVDGAKDILVAGLVIAFSKAILIIAQDGKILDTILNSIAYSVEDLPSYISVQAMFLVQSFLNLFVPSGSGQAALTMPIMSPLSDLLGISRQTAVLAFQFGDGLTNLIIPTSGVTMGVLAMGQVPYNKWMKWMLPMMITFFVIAMLLLIPPVMFFDWGPF